jgi:ADP-L-glycero-D-manno-heptose 6-epimerase
MVRHLPNSPSPRLHRRFTPAIGLWEVVSSYSSATAPDSHGISCADPHVLSSQRTAPRTSRLRLAAQDLFNFLVASSHSSLNLLVTGGAGFIGSNLTLGLQERFPRARLTVIDDFRSGDFKNLAGYRGDFVAQDLAKLDWREQFGDEKFDAIFHLASITDTTNHDQFEQVHDNVEGFRRILTFARPHKTRIIYASSAATYGAAAQASVESSGAAPANVYAFSKAIMDNIALRAADEFPDWAIVGLRYFNVYGPREAHKGVPASMVYHLSKQMKAGQNPRIFKHGEQQRDFVYVKDIVEGSIQALEARRSGVFNLGTGQARTFNELVDLLNQSLGTSLPPEYIDNPHAHYQNFTQADLSNVRSALGYEPRFPLEEGVKDYMKWLYPE